MEPSYNTEIQSTETLTEAMAIIEKWHKLQELEVKCQDKIVSYDRSD